MKQSSLFIAFALLVTLNCYPQNTKSYPVFILNDTFSHAQPKDSKIAPQNYQLTSLKGFKLDCSKYDFTEIRALSGGKNPDAIFIVCKSGNFIVELNISGVTIVDNSTMSSLDDLSKKFNEFQKGDTPILGIGTLNLKNGKAQMLTYWVSMIDVK